MNRREFYRTIIAGSIGLPLLGAAAIRTSRAADPAHPATRLNALSRTIDVDGRAAKVFGLLQPDGTHGVRLDAGEDFDVSLVNETNEDTIIHWHGLTPPWPLDGVPDQPMPLLKAGERRRYSFPSDRPGTHWMHAHTLQEQALLAAPLIVRGKDDLVRDEQEVVVLLHDFSFSPAAELLDHLRTQGGKGGMNMQGMGQSGSPDMAMNGGMASADINDIEYDAYLANDRTLNDPEIVRVERGAMVRLRIINGATATAFTIDTGHIEGDVIAVDGQDVVPMRLRQFPLAMGQRVDIRLRLPREGGAFPVLALREGDIQRTGIILASPGAAITKIADKGEAKGPLMSLDVETNLRPAAPLATRAADRRFTVDLVGDMQAYAWGMNADAGLVAREGERIVISMVNRTMMMHPMHLHGHHFQVVAAGGQPIAGTLRDTVFLPPMATVSIAFDATNPGKAWAFHCHHLYHMATGMMTSVAYENS